MRRSSRLAVIGWFALMPLPLAAEPAPDRTEPPPAVEEQANPQ